MGFLILRKTIKLSTINDGLTSGDNKLLQLFNNNNFDDLHSDVPPQEWGYEIKFSTEVIIYSIASAHRRLIFAAIENNNDSIFHIVSPEEHKEQILFQM